MDVQQMLASLMGLVVQLGTALQQQATQGGAGAPAQGAPGALTLPSPGGAAVQQQQQQAPAMIPQQQQQTHKGRQHLLNIHSMPS